MSAVRAEPYTIKCTGNCSVAVWQLLCDFSNKQWDDGVKNLLTHMTKSERNTSAWEVAFDFCRLSGKTEVLNTLTEKYAALFGKAPPEWVNTPASALAVNATPRGIILNIVSMTTPESEQYEAVHTQLTRAKTALLIRFTDGKPLSWQGPAVDRLAKIITDITSWKLPVYGENLEIAVSHIEKINADARTTADWEVLFFCLRGLARLDEFEDQAMQYAMARGMSPPSYAPLPDTDKTKWFEDAAQKDVVDEAGGDTMLVSGPLANAMHSIQTKTLQKLQTKPSVTIDLQGVSHIDWSSAVDFVTLHDKLMLSSRKIFAQKPSALVRRMLLVAGLPEEAILGTLFG